MSEKLGNYVITRCSHVTAVKNTAANNGLTYLQVELLACLCHMVDMRTAFATREEISEHYAFSFINLSQSVPKLFKAGYLTTFKCGGCVKTQRLMPTSKARAVVMAFQLAYERELDQRREWMRRWKSQKSRA